LEVNFFLEKYKPMFFVYNSGRTTAIWGITKLYFSCRASSENTHKTIPDTPALTTSTHASPGTNWSIVLGLACGAA
jgi:hypothetical protein